MVSVNADRLIHFEVRREGEEAGSLDVVHDDDINPDEEDGEEVGMELDEEEEMDDGRVVAEKAGEEMDIHV